MIKQLFFTAALLVPSLAYAGPPSATLPGQIVPAGPGPAVPAPAAAAGFTTLALNADFSQPTYSNVANWVDGCGGATTGYRWVYTYYLDGNRPGGQPPCSRIVQEFDSSIGKNVLHWQARNGDSTYNVTTNPNGQNGINLTWPGAAGGTGSAALPPGFGPEWYAEITFKLGAGGLVQTPSPPSVAGKTYYIMNWFGAGPGVVGQTNWLEPDNFEITANSNTGSGNIYGDGTTEWVNSTIGNGIFQTPPDGLATDQTVYHTIGVLLTSDGTQFSKCFYLNGTKIGCWKFTATNPSVLTALKQYITLGIGQTELVNNVDLYMQNYQIWMCANWKTQACTGSLIYP